MARMSARRSASPEVSQMASKVSALKKVRNRMLELQRAIGQRGSVVAEGRDIGTVIFPQAQVKIFLDASLEERARRRYEELKAAGQPVDLQEPCARWRSATNATASAISRRCARRMTRC